MRKGCIYLIKNKVNNKKYVGQTINFKKRKRVHLLHLKNNDHHNKHLQNSYNKYGIENFNIKIIENNIKRKNLDEKEVYWINYYNTYNGDGYNLTPGGKVLRGEDNPFYGMQHSKETRIRMKRNHVDVSGINNPMYGADLNGENNPMYGKKHKEETIKIMKNKKQGIKNPRSKVNQRIADEIYYIYKNTDLSFAKVGKIYNLGTTTIGKIVNGNHWATKYLD